MQAANLLSYWHVQVVGVCRLLTYFLTGMCRLLACLRVLLCGDVATPIEGVGAILNSKTVY
jgi:hypothetical protein